MLAAAAACAAGMAAQQQQPPPTPVPPAATQPSSPVVTTPPQQAPTPAPPPPPRNVLTTVVLDAAHGGADSGARGSAGVIEKEMTLALAKATRRELEAKGLRVLMTREGDQNPTLDERAALVNARGDVVFITLHVGSIGEPGTARAYFFEPPPKAASAEPERTALVNWDTAQYRYSEMSHQLAGLVQVQIGQKLRGSSEVPLAGAVRQLRVIHAPAIAVEVASVSVANRKVIDAVTDPLAEAIARGVLSFSPVYSAGGK